MKGLKVTVKIKICYFPHNVFPFFSFSFDVFNLKHTKVMRMKKCIQLIVETCSWQFIYIEHKKYSPHWLSKIFELL